MNGKADFDSQMQFHSQRLLNLQYLRRLETQNRILKERKLNLAYKSHLVFEPPLIKETFLNGNFDKTRDQDRIGRLSGQNPVIDARANFFNNANSTTSNDAICNLDTINKDNVPVSISSARGRISTDDINQERVSFHNVTQQYSAFVHDLDSKIEYNSKLLLRDKLQSLPKDQQLQRAKREESKQSRQNIELLLKKQQSSYKLPLWRHKLLGYSDPPKILILGGARLLRCIVRTLISLIIRPALASHHREMEKREIYRKEFDKTVLLILDTLGDWLGKAIQLPVSSIVHDDSIDFSVNNGFVGTGLPFRSRAIQLKVRLKSVIHNIIGTPLPPPHVINLLVTLVKDGVYFPSDFLWEFETRSLEFTRLGATRNMIPCCTPDEESLLHVVSIDMIDHNKRFDGSRVRMMIINVLLVRVLVFRILLAPWQFKISSFPHPNSAEKVKTNLKILATLVYSLLRELNSDLPIVVASADEVTSVQNMKSSSFWSTIVGSAFYLRGSKRKVDDMALAEDQSLQVSLNRFVHAEMIPSLLLPNNVFDPIRSAVDECRTELVTGISVWLDSVTRHIVEICSKQYTR